MLIETDRERLIEADRQRLIETDRSQGIMAIIVLMWYVMCFS